MMTNGSRAAMGQAVDDMIRVLDVVDAIHADTPEFAAAVLDELGPMRTAEAGLRLLDVIVHVVLAERPGGVANITAQDFTDYIRRTLGGEDV